MATNSGKDTMIIVLNKCQVWCFVYFFWRVFLNDDDNNKGNQSDRIKGLEEIGLLGSDRIGQDDVRTGLCVCVCVFLSDRSIDKDKFSAVYYL